MTRPGFTGCLNCLWHPTCATSYQPSCFKRCMTSRLYIRYNTHFLHTCQVGFTESQQLSSPKISRGEKGLDFGLYSRV